MDKKHINHIIRIISAKQNNNLYDLRVKCIEQQFTDYIYDLESRIILDPVSKPKNNMFLADILVKFQN
tara:strand:+ start:431 stop:634 length:204 start_codon:yes stop_codon:yes gene_type:complete